MGPPEVHGVAVISSDKPTINSGGEYVGVWFQVQVRKSKNLQREGMSRVMTYRCYIRCSANSPLPQFIRKGQLIEYKGSLIHAAYKKENGWVNYYYIDLHDNGITFINLDTIKSALEEDEIKMINSDDDW